MLARRLASKSVTVITVASATLLAGCTTTPLAAEKSARADVRSTGAALLAREGRPALPVLRTGSPPDEFVRYAVLNHPSVAAAYHDWRASVEEIAPTRALPEPQLTFEADVADMLMSFMPGLMFDFMGAGKRAAMGREATAAASVAQRGYISVVLNTAAEARKAWIELAFIDEAIRLRELSAGALGRLRAIAGTDYTTGRGMGALTDQVRFTNDLARLQSELVTLADRRMAVRARFKSALGLAPADPDPAWPQAVLTPTALPGEDELWRRASATNAGLGRMRAMVEMAVAGVEVARKAGRPDFTLGVMADLKADPLMVRPTATLKLPVWREKIAANIAAAEARRDASVARVTAEQLNLAAELAQMLYMVREADRMIAFIEHTALPNFARTIATAEAGYQSGMSGPAMIPETQLMALAMRLERAAALRERETAVTDLMLLTADVAPAGSPLPEPQS
ncbi:MAG: TolC family protein [Opitutae bacterium]|nr:TolC family protein [Opitutae bacterium]